MDLSLEQTIRHMIDGLDGKDHGIYISFDLRIQTKKDYFDQRDVAIGIHFLRFQGRVLGAVNEDFFASAFSADLPWESVSTHGSCWADSFCGYINDIVRDVMTNKNKSKFCRKYRDDKLKFGKEYSTHIMIQTVKIVPQKDLETVVYTDRHNDDQKNVPLIWKALA